MVSVGATSVVQETSDNEGKPSDGSTQPYSVHKAPIVLLSFWANLILSHPLQTQATQTQNSSCGILA
jgi:hypothetical protein